MECGALVNEMLLMMSGDIESNPGPSTALTLKTVFNALYSVSHKWSDIGLQLDVPIFQLRIIETDTTGATKRLQHTLEYWINNASDPLPSWKVLVDALNASPVGERRLAKELEERYCCPEDRRGRADIQSSVNTSKPMQEGRHMSQARSTLGCELTSESMTTIQSYSSIPSSCMGSEKPPFGCGCGRCTFFAFTVIDCSKARPSVSSFPYLDLSELTPEQQLVLRGKLRTEFKKITIQFQHLVSTTLKSLQKQCITVCEFLSHLMTFGTYEPVLKDSKAPVFDQRLNDLEKAKDLSEVFMGIKDYMSFFNYHLIEHIINVLGTEEVKTELKKYKINFQQYAKRRVYECPPQFGPISEVGHADIFVKVDSQYENYTVAEIEEFRQTLSELLCVEPEGVLHLCQVEKGCFQLTFQVPSFLKEEVFPLSREQERALAAEGVIWLVCGKYQFQKDEPSQAGVERKSQHEDDDSGMGPSISTTRKSTCTTFTEDPLDKELEEELDYELRVKGLEGTASSQESSLGLNLHLAVLIGQLETVKVLVEEMNYDPMQRNHEGVSAVHMAAIHGHLQVFKYFITDRSCNPVCVGPLGLTPLHLASERGHLDIVRYLVIDQQIDPLYEDEHGNTALHRACAGGCQAVVELLSAEIVKYNPITQVISDLRNKWHSTPLHAAVINGHLNIAKFSISENNCDPNNSGQSGITPLHLVALCGHLHIVKYLTNEQCCNPSCLDGTKLTPLHYAAMEGHIDVVKFLTLEKHCDPMCRDTNQETPLHIAVLKGQMGMVKFLTAKLHCNLSSRDAQDATALHVAVEGGHLDIVRYFISDQNCDPNIPGQSDETPLHYAAEFGHMHIVKYLTNEQGCDPSCLDDTNWTPLHFAAMRGHLNVVRFLTLEKHCDPMCTMTRILLFTMQHGRVIWI